MCKLVVYLVTFYLFVSFALGTLKKHWSHLQIMPDIKKKKSFQSRCYQFPGDRTQGILDNSPGCSRQWRTFNLMFQNFNRCLHLIQFLMYRWLTSIQPTLNGDSELAMDVLSTINADWTEEKLECSVAWIQQELFLSLSLRRMTEQNGLLLERQKLFIQVSHLHMLYWNNRQPW